MRAVVVREFGGIDKAALGDMPKPELTPDGVLLDVHAASVNFVDLVVMGGTYQFSPKLPYIPGKLPVGIVAAVGTDVKDVKPGDRVLAMAEQGAFAEQVMAPAKQCVPLPAALPFTEAAAMALIYDTAYFALKERGRIQPGESVLILGATGGVGLAAIQLAKAMGGKVLAAVASKSKEDIVHAAGADEIIDLSAPDLRESLRAQVYEKVGKGGVDIIIDMLGGDPFDAAVRALASGTKAFYTTPLKALSNQKFGDFVRAHGADQVGLLTGDNTVRGDAPVVGEEHRHHPVPARHIGLRETGLAEEFGHPEELGEGAVLVGQPGQLPALVGGKGDDVVVEVLDQDAPVGIAQRCHEFGDEDPRVRHPVAVVPVVQRRRGRGQVLPRVW